MLNYYEELLGGLLIFMVVVSVIMATYKRIEYLREAIQSVLNQNFTDFEFIITNDQDDISIDQVGKTINEFSKVDHRIIADIKIEKRNIAKAWNDALCLASGKYTAIIGSDDVWEPEKLDEQLRVLRSNKDSLVWTDASIINPRGEKVKTSFSEMYASEKNFKECNNLTYENYIPSQSIIFDSDLGKSIKFNEEIPFFCDYIFLLEAYHRVKFIHIKKELVRYRIHGGNLTLNRKEEWKRQMLMLENLIMRRYKLCKKAKVILLARVNIFLFTEINIILMIKNIVNLSIKHPIIFSSYIIYSFKHRMYYTKMVRGAIQI